MSLTDKMDPRLLFLAHDNVTMMANREHLEKTPIPNSLNDNGLSDELYKLRQLRIPASSRFMEIGKKENIQKMKRERSFWEHGDPKWNSPTISKNNPHVSVRGHTRASYPDLTSYRQMSFLKPDLNDASSHEKTRLSWKQSSSTLSRKSNSDSTLTFFQRSATDEPILSRISKFDALMSGSYFKRSRNFGYNLYEEEIQDNKHYSCDNLTTDDVLENSYDDSRADYVVRPLLRFKHAVKTVIVLLKATKQSGAQQLPDSRLLSFTQYQDELIKTKSSVFGDELVFDPMHYKSRREVHLSNEAKTILSLEPRVRTEEQLHVALVALQQTAEAFSEFPVKMQKSLARVGWYEHFESKRVIIRQGHTADNFYFILSGTAVVTILESGDKSAEPFVRTAALLRKGHSFGELALMHGATRSATVTCKEDVELLAVARDDFIDIFMPVEKGKVPEHIRFLRELDVLRGWPVSSVPWENPKICLLTYFRRGVVMCRASDEAEWVYFIKSGSCSVLKTLTSASPDIPGLHKQSYLPLLHSPTHRPRGLVCRHGSIKRQSKASPTSSVSSLSSSPRQLSDADHAHNENHVLNNCTSTGQLPPIVNKTKRQMEFIAKEHKKSIEALYNRKHDRHSPQLDGTQSPTQSSDLKKPKSGKTVFVKILTLGPKQIFGLDGLVFDDLEKATSVSLVSDGAEAVLINRKFFVSHLSDDVRKKMRNVIQPYPSETSLQQKLQNETNWEAFKSMTVNDHVYFTKYVHDTLHI